MSRSPTNSTSEATYASDSSILSETSYSWIVRCHEEWTQATVGPFFSEVAGGNLAQLRRWLSDTLLITRHLSKSAASVERKLGFEVPLRRCLAENASQLSLISHRLGAEPVLDMDTHYACRSTLEALDHFTTEAIPMTGLSFVLGYSLASVQGFRLAITRARRRDLDSRFLDVADWMTRDDALTCSLLTQEILDTFMAQAPEDTLLRSYKAFQMGVSGAAATVLDVGLVEGDPRLGRGGNCPRCGRYGHEPAKCTFKAHVLSSLMERPGDDCF